MEPMAAVCVYLDVYLALDSDNNTAVNRYYRCHPLLPI
jgi:hypothetical protein